jgi:hypothetical protein
VPVHETPERVRTPHPAEYALRELAASGRLATIELAAEDPVRAAAYAIAWPLVWQRHTRRLEIGKGHAACAASLRGMAAPCLDRFHDDVEAVVEYLFARGGKRIHNLEGWITSRIGMATVDGYRKRRGRMGALQRVRVPNWLATALGHDRELVDLAASIIEWVGVPATAGIDLWPLQAWADRRAAATGDATVVRVERIAADIERVLTAMKGVRPDWYATYIERPMGHKQVPALAVPAPDQDMAEAARARAQREDAERIQLAAAATDAISAALTIGEDPADAVPRVLRAVFLAGPAGAPVIDAIDVEPGRDPAEGSARLATVLEDEAALAGLVDRVLGVVRATGPGLVRGHS